MASHSDDQSENKVDKITIYYSGEKQPRTDIETDGRTQDYEVEFVPSKYPGPELKDTEIEEPRVRAGLNRDEANICISVQPGEEELGQIFICAQHEGKKGLTDECMRGQNNLAESIGDWLNDLFEDSPQPWTFKIHAEPCPDAQEPFRAIQIASRIEGRREIERDWNLNQVQERDRERDQNRRREQ